MPRVERSGWLRAGAVVAVATASALLVHWLALRHNSFDVRVYRGAVESWLHGGDLYAYGLGSRQLGFTYPPFAAICMVPMLLLPLQAVIALNALITVGSVVASVRVVVGRLPALARWGGWFVTALLVPAVCVLQPVRDTLTFGQVNIVLAALVLMDLVLLERGSRWAGVGIGLAAAIKLTPGLFVVFLLVAGLRRAAGTAVATFTVATALAVAVAPGTSWSYWTSVLPDSSRIGHVDSASNQSLAGVLARLGNSGEVPIVWWPVVLVVTAWALWAATHQWRSGAHLTAFTMVGLAAAVASPISWVHHLWWVVPALLLVAEEALRARSPALGVIVIALAVLFASGLPDRARAVDGHHLTAASLIGENAYALVCLTLLLLLPRLPRLHAAHSSGRSSSSGGSPTLRTPPQGEDRPTRER